MRCELVDSFGVLSLSLGKHVESCCHIVRGGLFLTRSTQFIKNAATLVRSQPCNQAYAVFGPLVNPVGKMAEAAAYRAGTNLAPGDLHASARSHCNRRRAPNEPTVVAYGWDQIPWAWHCPSKLAERWPPGSSP